MPAWPIVSQTSLATGNEKPGGRLRSSAATEPSSNRRNYALKAARLLLLVYLPILLFPRLGRMFGFRDSTARRESRFLDDWYK